MSGNSAIDFHNQIAAQFARKYESSVAFSERFRVWTNLFEQYIKSTDQVMDLGCGSGVFSHYLAQKGCQVLGIDGSRAMIDLCNQQKTATTVRYVQQSLPFSGPDQYDGQDAIVMSSLLEYIADTTLMQQVKDLLKPNGLLIVSMPNALSVYRRVERILFRLTGYPAYFTHARNRPTESAFRQQLTNTGFDVLEIVYFSGHDPISRLLNPWLSRRYTNNLFVMVCRKREEQADSTG